MDGLNSIDLRCHPFGVESAVVADPDPALLWTHKPPPPPAKPRRGELLFEFVRAATARRFAASCGSTANLQAGRSGSSNPQKWEFYARGGFLIREVTVKWAAAERAAMVERS